MKKYVCLVCGYVHNGDEAPKVCPVCGAGMRKDDDFCGKCGAGVNE